ncbi:MAG TPA: copper homeostasis protein CutC [Rudaea sp.]|nr:copper homeostasis protein CutC [Rudaea sp.]
MERKAAVLEIAANSLASALAAQEGGANRIELCAALEVGGLTPSYAQIALTRERVRIPIYTLIRPRTGDFAYSDNEYETMQRDIETCVSLGCDGVVIGALDGSGAVDTARCRTLIAAAGKLGVTFHRAFDMSDDPRHALEDIIALGCERVLTSGARADALAGAELIKRLVAQADGRISVMPGAGVNAGNIAALRALTGASEFHASAKRELPSRRRGGNNLPGMTDGEVASDVEQVRALVRALSEPNG